MRELPQSRCIAFDIAPSLELLCLPNWLSRYSPCELPRRSDIVNLLSPLVCWPKVRGGVPLFHVVVANRRQGQLAA
jgi:hypothetical protein